MRRRTFVTALGAAAAASVIPGVARAAVPLIAPTLTGRDPAASGNAQSVYSHLVSMENAARSGSSPMTIIGQHIETQQELYNASYGDTGGTTFSGYYYRKARDITGKLSGFIEIDLGPGYGATGWGTYGDRSYNQPLGLPTGLRSWQYTDDAVDLACGVWKGLPRAADGTYNPDGTMVRLDGTTASLTNGGAASGIVGMSFHQPYPGSSVKSWSRVLTQVEGEHPGGYESYPVATLSTDQAWFDRVLDWESDTDEYRALLADLGFLAATLSYFAAWDVPVLLRPYHEMNGDWFWWGGKTAASYKKLWRITYDYLVRTKGLHNLIFVWSPNGWKAPGSGVPWDYYPGADLVDVVAVDDYYPGYSDFTNVYYTGLVDYAKPRMLAETYNVPITAAGSNALTPSPWVIWSTWGTALTRGTNTNADVKATYYATDQVYTGGSGTGFGQNFAWGSIHAH
ncbi:glycoside hydrolase family 26 protein [Streptomyces fulvoviolaceus]|uniref:glycoside hydrolase family 26 protein n=1 Tax=Streptomyces fulvoviolaceus TaxID=285535 RepID=UPI0021BEEBE2|nr:glycoside hydrolase family 26 protein [Streptomyces fulvoviolaceus]MCT9083806.1 glycoside hydrolase family 26 protein [Streptomyces fulvoviolaceus]